MQNRGRQNCDGSRAQDADRLLIRPASGRQAGTGLSTRTHHWKDTATAGQLGTVEATLQLVDHLDRQIGDCERDLQRLGVEHRYVPLLVTVQASAGCSPTQS